MKTNNGSLLTNNDICTVTCYKRIPWADSLYHKLHNCYWEVCGSVRNRITSYPDQRCLSTHHLW